MKPNNSYSTNLKGIVGLIMNTGDDEESQQVQDFAVFDGTQG